MDTMYFQIYAGMLHDDLASGIVSGRLIPFLTLMFLYLTQVYPFLPEYQALPTPSALMAVGQVQGQEEFRGLGAQDTSQQEQERWHSSCVPMASGTVRAGHTVSAP